MQAEVVRPEDLGEREVKAWIELQRGRPELDNGFLHPAFAKAASKLRPQSRIAVLEQDGQIGFLAFEKGKKGFATALAQGYSDTQALITPPGTSFPLDHALKSAGIKLWSFDHLVSEQVADVSEAPSRFSEVPSPMINLTDGYDTYVTRQSMHSKTLFSLNNRRRRQAERELGPLHFTWQSNDHALLDQVIAWKDDQYRRTGVPPVEDQVRTMLHELLDTHADGLHGWLSCVKAGDVLLAAHMGLRSRHTLSYWYPAYDSAYSRYSPGLILLLDMARRGAEDGISRIELGRGDEPYKARVGSGGNSVLTGFASTHPLTAATYPALVRLRERAVTYVVQSPRREAIARAGLRRARSLRTRAGSVVPLRS